MQFVNTLKNQFGYVRRNGWNALFRKITFKLKGEEDPAQRAKKRTYSDYEAMSVSEYPQALCDWYMLNTGDELHLEEPRSFNEKIQWLKLYDAVPLKTRLADKISAREYIAEIFGRDVLIPAYGPWDSFNDIDFDILPEKFVLKANHGCGYNEIVLDKSKIDKAKLKEKCTQWLSENYAFKNGLEMHYLNIKPRLYAEDFIGTESTVPDDYKISCVNGKAVMVQIVSRSEEKVRLGLYEPDWSPLRFDPPGEVMRMTDMPRPAVLDKLLEMAEKLAEGFALLRADFYVLNGNDIRFGEMTFTPASGVSVLVDSKVRRKWGDMMVLPEKKEIPVRL